MNIFTLAASLQEMLDTGAARNQAHVAEILGLSRSRVNQLLNLMKLPAAIVTEMCSVRDPAKIVHFTERRLRPITQLSSAKEQVQAFRTLKKLRKKRISS